MFLYIITYENYNLNGRLREFIKVMYEIGQIKGIMTQVKGQTINIKGLETLKVPIDYSLKNPFRYLYFLMKASIGVLRNIKCDYLVICNTPACIIGYYAKKLLNKRLVYDAYELKLKEERKGIMQKSFNFFEEKVIKAADVVICANQERAKIMQEYYKLNNIPVVFENIRKLEELGEVRTHIQDIISSIDSNKINVIYTGGYDVQRGMLKFLDAVRTKKDILDCYLIGGGSGREKKVIDEFILKNDLTNIKLVERVNQKELLHFLKACNIGLVQYHDEDLNNKYCASGKIYEYISQNLVVLASENPPLKKFCETYNVGVAVSDYNEGLNDIINNLDIYRSNIHKCKSEFTSYKNRQRLRDILNEKMEG